MMLRQSLSELTLLFVLLCPPQGCRPAEHLVPLLLFYQHHLVDHVVPIYDLAAHPDHVHCHVMFFSGVGAILQCRG